MPIYAAKVLGFGAVEIALLFSVASLPGLTAAVIARQEAAVLSFLRAFEYLQEELHPALFVQLQGIVMIGALSSSK